MSTEDYKGEDLRLNEGRRDRKARAESCGELVALVKKIQKGSRKGIGLVVDL